MSEHLGYYALVLFLKLSQGYNDSGCAKRILLLGNILR